MFLSSVDNPRHKNVINDLKYQITRKNSLKLQLKLIHLPGTIRMHSFSPPMLASRLPLTINPLKVIESTLSQNVTMILKIIQIKSSIPATNEINSYLPMPIGVSSVLAELTFTLSKHYTAVLSEENIEPAHLFCVTQENLSLLRHFKN